MPADAPPSSIAAAQGAGLLALIPIYFAVCRTVVIFRYLRSWENPDIPKEEREARQAWGQSCANVGALPGDVFTAAPLIPAVGHLSHYGFNRRAVDQQPLPQPVPAQSSRGSDAPGPSSTREGQSNALLGCLPAAEPARARADATNGIQ